MVDAQSVQQPSREPLLNRSVHQVAFFSYFPLLWFSPLESAIYCFQSLIRPNTEQHRNKFMYFASSSMCLNVDVECLGHCASMSTTTCQLWTFQSYVGKASRAVRGKTIPSPGLGPGTSHRPHWSVYSFVAGRVTARVIVSLIHNRNLVVTCGTQGKIMNNIDLLKLVSFGSQMSEAEKKKIDKVCNDCTSYHSWKSSLRLLFLCSKFTVIVLQKFLSAGFSGKLKDVQVSLPFPLSRSQRSK